MPWHSAVIYSLTNNRVNDWIFPNIKTVFALNIKDILGVIMLKEKWKELNWLSRVAYILVAITLLSLPIEGLIFESFDIAIIDIDVLIVLHYVSTAIAMFARQWKLALVAFVGFYVSYGITIGLSEVLWYYLKAWVGIDISYR